MSHSPAQPPLAAGTSYQKFLWIPISYNIKSKLLSICIALQFWPFPQLWAALCPELVSATLAYLKVIPLPSSMPAGCPPCQQADSSLHGCTQNARLLTSLYAPLPGYLLPSVLDALLSWKLPYSPCFTILYQVPCSVTISKLNCS